MTRAQKTAVAGDKTSGRSTFTTTQKCNKARGGCEATDQKEARSKGRTTDAITTVKPCTTRVRCRGVPTRLAVKKLWPLFVLVRWREEAMLRITSPVPCQRSLDSGQGEIQNRLHSAENPSVQSRESAQGEKRRCREQ